MAREVVTTTFTYCDICKRDGTRTDTTEPPIRLAVHGRAKRVDVCPEHKDPSWSQILDCMIDDLEASTPVAPKTGKLVCPWCDEPRGATQHGLLMHATRSHSDVALSEIQRTLGFPVTDRNEGKYRHGKRRGTTPGAHLAVTCPRCKRTFEGGTQGLAQHVIKVHGIHDRDERATLLRSAREKAVAASETD